MQCDDSVGPNPRRGEFLAASWPRALAAAFLACGVLWSGAARAESELRTTATGCDAYDLPRLDELLAIEVETVRSQHPSRPTDVVLECRGTAVALLVVLRETPGEKRGRVNPGEADQAARTRLLALAVSELLSQLWGEARAAPTPAASPPPAPAPPKAPGMDARSTVRAPRSSLGEGLALIAVFTTRGLFSPSAALFGAGIGAEYRLGSIFVVGSSLECTFGSIAREYAGVTLTVPSLALHALAEGRSGRLSIAAGGGARLGYARLKPTDVDAAVTGHDVGGLWAGPFAVVRSRWSVRRLDIYAALESGVITMPFAGTVNGEARLVDIDGVWLAGSAGIAALF